MTTKTMRRGMYMRMKTMAFQRRGKYESMPVFGAPLRKAKLTMINIDSLVLSLGVALIILVISIIIYALVYLR